MVAKLKIGVELKMVEHFRAMGGVLMAMVLVLVLGVSGVVAQHQFELVHGYGGRETMRVETMKVHDHRRLRRMLPEVVTFPLTGDDDVFITA